MDILRQIKKTGLASSAGHGWPSVPEAMDGEKGPLRRRRSP